MALDLTSIIKDVAPALISGAGAVMQNSMVKDQAKNFAQGVTGSANTLKQGYDAQLGEYETGYNELEKLLNSGLLTTTDATRRAAYDFKGDSSRNVDRYEGEVMPLVNQLSQGLSLSDILYGQGLDKAAGQTTETLQQGANQVADQYAPYIETGQNALGYLANIMGLDPNELSPEQMRTFEALTRDMTANLAASGLRGAGRSGVAAVNEGLADFRAKAVSENQRRQDAAAQSLNAQGFSATGQVANTIEGLKRAIADIQYKTGTTKAGNTFDVNSNIANTAYNAGQDVGSKRYAADTASTANIYNTNRDVANLADTNTQNLYNITANRYQNRGNTALSKSIADSAAGGAITDSNYAKAGQQQQITGTAVNNLLSGMTKETSDALKKVV